MQIENRIRALEQTATDRTPMLIYVPDGVPTLGQQQEIEQARAERRPVFIVNESDASL